MGLNIFQILFVVMGLTDAASLRARVEARWLQGKLQKILVPLQYNLHR
jgi:hypothetical protein